METLSETNLVQTGNKPRRFGSKLLFILAIIMEGLVLLGALVAGGLVIYSLDQTNQEKNAQLASITAERNRLVTEQNALKTRLDDTASQLKSASDLAAQNGNQAKQFELQVKDLEGKLVKSGADLDNLTAEKEKATRNYNETIALFDAYRGVVECRDQKKLTSPDYTDSSTIKTALSEYVDFYDGPVKKSSDFKFFSDHDTSIYEFWGQKYYYVFIVSFENDFGHRNTVYDVHGACFLDSGTAKP